MTTRIISYLSSRLLHPPEEPTIVARPFYPTKDLVEKDQMLIDMLNSQGHEDVCFCICDPHQNDMPIVFSSEGFCNFTGYAPEEIEGRNCRFLQGEQTSQEDVSRIRKAIASKTEANVNLVNYRKDGSTFVNQFYLAPMYSKNDPSDTIYFIGVQCSVDRQGPGQMPANPGEFFLLGVQP